MTFRTIPLLAAALIAAPVFLATAPAALGASKAAKAQKVPPPVTVESLLAGSRAAAAKGDSQLALRLAQSAIVADPARPGSYVALGKIYAMAGDDEYARSFYQAALGIDPADTGALGAMAALDKQPGARAANTTSKTAGP